MRRYILLLILFYNLNIFSQEKSFKNNQILFDFSLQKPFSDLSQNFGNNSSIELGFLQNKNDFLTILDVNFMFGNNVKDSNILQLISTENGYLINIAEN